jgi:hypothetical protein
VGSSPASPVLQNPRQDKGFQGSATSLWGAPRPRIQAKNQAKNHAQNQSKRRFDRRHLARGPSPQETRHLALEAWLGQRRDRAGCAIDCIIDGIGRLTFANC